MERLVNLNNSLSGSVYKQSPLKVTVTGAAGNIGYALVFMIGQGYMLGSQKIDLTLLELPQAKSALEGVVMELKDSAFNCLNSIRGSTELDQAFQDCELAILVGARPRGPGMERKDLLSANAMIFKQQGESLNRVGNVDCRVVVVGNPANTNAMICSKFASRIPKQNFTALTRLDQNRAVAQIADKTSKKVDEIRNIIIWGNHSLTQYPDLVKSTINGKQTSEIVNDQKWTQGQFISDVAKRGGVIIKQRKASSAASAASSTCDHVRSWLMGTTTDEIVSMGVMTDGTKYGIKAGICFSMPVQCKAGSWKVVEGIKINEFSQQKIESTEKELLQEQQMALKAFQS